MIDEALIGAEAVRNEKHQDDERRRDAVKRGQPILVRVQNDDGGENGDGINNEAEVEPNAGLDDLGHRRQRDQCEGDAQEDNENEYFLVGLKSVQFIDGNPIRRLGIVPNVFFDVFFRSSYCNTPRSPQVPVCFS